MFTTPVIISICVFAVVSLALWGVMLLFMRRERRIDRRVDGAVRSADATDTHETADSAIVQLLQGMLPKLGERLAPDGDRAKGRIKERLIHAGYYGAHAVTYYVLAKFCLMVLLPALVFVAWVAGFLSFFIALLLAGCAGGLGMIAPSFWLHNRKMARHAILRKSLPDYLDLLVACVEGGMSLQAGLQRVADELRIAHPLLASEMEMVQREVELGATLESAVRHFADRCDLDSVRSLARFIHQSQRFGTTIGEALREHAEMLRAQREQIAEEAAQKAVVKILIPTMLFIFPSIFIVLAGPAAIKLSETFAKNPSEQSLRGE